MADDLLGGVLGGEDEQPETEAPQALAGADAFAAAVAARLSSNDPEVARDTSTFLKKQSRLLDLQAQHLEDEHVSRLSHLRLTVGAARRKRYADHVRNCVYTGIALLVLGVLAAAARMTVEAMSDHSLVVENFTVPSDFAARGVTSQALAEDLSSRIAAIRATANRISLTYSNDVRSDQADVLKVQIPETGISLDQLERFLHRWLGHQTVVNAELREEPGGPTSIVLHVAGADPIVVSGAGTNLDGLMQAAAEQAFAIFDPPNDVIYLSSTGYPAEAYDAALRYVQSASAAASRPDRANAYTLVAHTDPDSRRALSRARVAIAIDPGLMVDWIEAARASSDLGHDEAVLDFRRKCLETKRRDQLPSQQGAYTSLIASARIAIDQALGNFAALQSDGRANYRRLSQQPATAYAASAEIAAHLHEEAAALQDLTLARAAEPAGGEPPSVAVLQARWYVSTATGDWAQALDAAKALVAGEEAQKSAAPNPEFAARPELVLETQYQPLLAYAEAMTGDTTSATALIAQTPTDCYLCVRTRAKVAAVAGDAATADRWFAEAIRQAPDLPMAYYEWGQALAARGDLAGAARELALAHQRGPHFADALKAWGDVLVKQGQRRAALAKYDQALKYAPQWAALKQAREAAARHRA